MKCVRCEGSLVAGEYEGVEVDQCPQCRGTWLDNQELAHAVKKVEKTFSPALVKEVLTKSANGVPDSERHSVETCPKCGSHLKAVNYGYASGVILDVCPNGHGHWLDAEELDKVQAYAEEGNQKLAANSEKWHAAAHAERLSVEKELSRSTRKLNSVTRSLFHLLTRM